MAWTKLGVVLPLGAALEFDDTWTFAPAPLLVDGRVLLYYAGADGATYRVGMAGSDDGVHFTKLGVVLPLGGAGEFDDTHTSGPAPLLLDGRVLLYYVGYDGNAYRVGVAGSDDGVHFTKLGVVLPLGGAGEFDEERVWEPGVMMVDGRVLLYYVGFDGALFRVGLAASDDGVRFTKLGVVVPVGGAGEWDVSGHFSARPVLLDGGVLVYYSGAVAGVRRQGLAQSADGVHFTKLGVMLPVGGVGDFDSGRTEEGAPLAIDGRMLVYYAGYDGATYRIGLAASDEGI